MPTPTCSLDTEFLFFDSLTRLASLETKCFSHCPLCGYSFFGYSFSHGSGSGGTITTQDASGTRTVRPTTDSYGYSASARLVGSSSTSNSTYVSATLNGPLIANLHWVADAGTNSPPPAQVSVTQTCNFNWSLSDYDHGVSGSYTTGLGQSGPMATGTSSTGGGSKTTTVSTGGQTDFQMSISPTASISGYVRSSCSYDLFGYSYTVAASFASVTLQAHSTKDTAGWDPTHPAFFSGTNCSATASATAASGYVSHAQLLVGTTVVKDYYDTTFPNHPAAGPNVSVGTNQSTASLSVNFDSTYFADSSAIPIKMVVTDTGGNTYNGTVQATAYNKGYVGYEAPNGTDNSVDKGQATAAAVDSAMTASNISKTDSLPNQYRAPVITAITANTVFFTYSHGNENPDAINGPNFESPAGVGNTNELIYPNRSLDPHGNSTPPRDDVAEAVANKGVNVPPYNFVFLDICNGAFNVDFTNGFGIPPGPYASGIPTADTIDRAFLGWDGVVEDSDVNTQWTKAIYGFLQNGDTLNQAIDKAGSDITKIPKEENPNSPNFLKPCRSVIRGDGDMTLHGHVYGGTSWYK